MAFGEPEYGICNGCGEERLIEHKKKWLCGDCNTKRKMKEKGGRSFPSNSTLKPMSDKGRKVKEEDDITYEKLWDSRPHFCEECGLFLGHDLRDENGRIFARHRFSHILPKGNYPEFRWCLENFNLLCFEHHNMWENAATRKQMKIFKKNVGRIAKLKGLSYDEVHHLLTNVPE